MSGFSFHLKRLYALALILVGLSSAAAGELIFHVFGAIAHFERRLISERTKDGIVAARARGKLPGRYPLDMAKVDAAIKLIEARVSPAEAARQLGIGRPE